MKQLCTVVHPRDGRSQKKMIPNLLRIWRLLLPSPLWSSKPVSLQILEIASKF